MEPLLMALIILTIGALAAAGRLGVFQLFLAVLVAAIVYAVMMWSP